jgi:lipopolysaccharide export system protein LptA
MEADWARVTLQRLPPSDALEPLMLEARGGVRLTDEQGGIASGERMSWSRRDGRAVLEGDPVHVERRTPEGAAQTIACRRAEFDTERGIGRFTGDAIVSVREENRDPVTVRGAEVEAAFRRPPEGAQESEPELEGITVRDPRAAALEMGDRIRVEARQIWISGDQSTARVDGLRSARLRREDGTEYDIIGIGGMRFEGREVVLEGDVGLAGGAETLRARRIRLVLAEDRSLERMHASGDVVFSREGIVARSDELTYDAAAGEAHLRGNPVAVERGGTVMRVEEAWIDLATNAFRGRSTRARSRIVWREGG